MGVSSFSIIHTRSSSKAAPWCSVMLERFLFRSSAEPAGSIHVLCISTRIDSQSTSSDHHLWRLIWCLLQVATNPLANLIDLFVPADLYTHRNIKRKVMKRTCTSCTQYTHTHTHMHPCTCVYVCTHHFLHFCREHRSLAAWLAMQLDSMYLHILREFRCKKNISIVLGACFKVQARLATGSVWGHTPAFHGARSLDTSVAWTHVREECYCICLHCNCMIKRDIQTRQVEIGINKANQEKSEKQGTKSKWTFANQTI